MPLINFLTQVISFIDLDPHKFTKFDSIVNTTFNTVHDKTGDLYKANPMARLTEFRPQHFLSEGLKEDMRRFYRPFDVALQSLLGRRVPWLINDTSTCEQMKVAGTGSAMKIRNISCDSWPRLSVSPQRNPVPLHVLHRAKPPDRNYSSVSHRNTGEE